MKTVYIGGLSTSASDNPLFNHFTTTDNNAQLEADVINIIISPNSFNNKDVLFYRLRGLDDLISVEIADNCFNYVTEVVFEGLSSLETITIGNTSFYNTSSLILNSLIILIPFI